MEAREHQKIFFPTQDELIAEMREQQSVNELVLARQQEVCRTCVHRIRCELNPYSRKVVQCCELQKSKRSNSGFKTIKVTDKACGYYKRKEARNDKE